MADTAAATGAAGDAAAKISLDVLELIKTAQAQNGLRHNDYDRYSQYCTRRLHRIRHANQVNLTYGKGKKFVNKVLTADMVTDARHLQVPLMNAERAWAVSQKLKADASDGSGGAEGRYHPKQRLRKAVKWANLLESLAVSRADARTSLECQAYAAWMRALLAVDTEDWTVASDNVITAKKIYEQLAAASVRRQKELFAARVEEMAPIERFCKYNLARKAGKGAVTKAAEGLDDKIAAALAEAKDGGASTEGNAIYWRTTHFVVRNPKLKTSLLSAGEKGTMLSAETEVANAANTGSASSKTEYLYLELLSRYDEAAKQASAEANRAAKDGRVEIASDYRAIEEYIRFVKLRHILERNATLIGDAVTALHDTVAGKGSAGGSNEANKGKLKRVKDAINASAAIKSTGTVYTENPWLASLAGVSTQQSLATGISGPAGGANATLEGVNAPAANAANAIATWYARSLRTIDEMIILAGGNPPRDNPVSQDVAATAPPREKGLAEDAELVAVLNAQRSTILAWRAYFIAIASIYNKKYSDATVLMNRAQERAHLAMDLFESLPEGLRPKKLPEKPLTPGSDAATHPAVPLSGVSQIDVASVKLLLDKIAQQTVALQATALLEQLAPKLRPDGSFAEVYTSTFYKKEAKPTAPATLKRSDRPVTLSEKLVDGVVYGTVDAASVENWPIAPKPAPFKPLLLDLAYGFFQYPEIKSTAAAAATETKAKPAAKESASTTNTTTASAPEPAPASGGGLFGWFGR